MDVEIKQVCAVDITGRDSLIIGLALAYGITVMRAVARHGRAPLSDLHDMSRLMAQYPPQAQKAFFQQAYCTAVGSLPTETGGPCYDR